MSNDESAEYEYKERRQYKRANFLIPGNKPINTDAIAINVVTSSLTLIGAAKSVLRIHSKHQSVVTMSAHINILISAVVALCGLAIGANINLRASVECPESADGQSVFLPYPYDCGKYYHCVGEVPILRECPDNLHFDTSVDVCNFPELAGCIPDLRVCEHGA